MKVFLTGVAGFIGFHTTKALLARGDEVIGLDNFSPYYDPELKENRIKQLEGLPGFTLIRGSILEPDTWREQMKGCDRVLHLAAIAGVRYSCEHPEEYIDTNIRGFFEIVEAVRRLEIPGLIYASSSSVYGGNTSFPSKEEDRVDDQLSLYGMNKRDNEIMAHTYHHLYGVHVTGLRFFTVYGPWGRPDMALFKFTDLLLNDKPLPLFNGGKMKRDFTFIDDIVSGIVGALDNNYEEEIFNLASGRQEELMDFVGKIEECCGKEAEKDMLPMQLGDVPASQASIEKAARMIGYDPKTSIAEGIPQFVDWYREYYKI